MTETGWNFPGTHETTSRSSGHDCHSTRRGNPSSTGRNDIMSTCHAQNAHDQEVTRLPSAAPVTVQSLPAIGLRSLGPCWSTCRLSIAGQWRAGSPGAPSRRECGRHGVVIGVRAVARQLADHVRHHHGLRAPPSTRWPISSVNRGLHLVTRLEAARCSGADGDDSSPTRCRREPPDGC